MSAPSLEVLLAQAEQLRGAAKLLHGHLDRMQTSSPAEGSHVRFSASHAVAIDALCERVVIGIRCAIDRRAADTDRRNEELRAGGTTCQVHAYASAVCALGTKSCVVIHPRAIQHAAVAADPRA